MSILDEAIQMFNSGEIRTNDQAISRTTNLIGKLKEALKRREENKNKPEVTPEEIRKAGRQAIEDFKNMFREEAGNAPKNMYRPEMGNVPEDMIYQNHENMLEEAMNSLNAMSNRNTLNEINKNKESVQEQKNEGMDR